MKIKGACPKNTKTSAKPIKRLNTESPNPVHPKPLSPKPLELLTALLGGTWDLVTSLMNKVTIVPQRVQSTYIVECRVSILGIVIMIWESTPHNST